MSASPRLSRLPDSSDEDPVDRDRQHHHERGDVDRQHGHQHPPLTRLHGLHIDGAAGTGILIRKLFVFVLFVVGIVRYRGRRRDPATRLTEP